MMNKHVFWLLIDSARNHVSDDDDRGLPVSLLEWSKKGFFFRNVVTSAPSTLMSVSAMMASKRAASMSLSYSYFNGIPKGVETLPLVLTQAGYQTHGAIYFKHGREVLSNLFGGVLKRKYMPSGLSNTKTVWSNQDMQDILKNIIKKNDWTRPTFTYLHFNVRIDKDISDILDESITLIQKSIGLDNCTIIINSDHGYPSHSRGLNHEKLKKEGWGHDYLMTDDNILTPLILLDSDVGTGYNDSYHSTLDIAPTLLAILGLKSPNGFEGSDLFAASRNRKLTITDNRFYSQEPSKTAIIEYPFKLIRHTNKNREAQYELYDLSLDSNELSPIDNRQSNIKDSLLKKLLVEENRLVKGHLERISIPPKLRSILQTTKYINIVYAGIPKLAEIWEEKIKSQFPEVFIELISSVIEIDTMEYVVCIVDNEIPWENNSLFKLFKNRNPKSIIYIDPEGNSLGKYPRLSLLYRYFHRRKRVFINEPSYLFSLILRIIRRTQLKSIE